MIDFSDDIKNMIQNEFSEDIIIEKNGDMFSTRGIFDKYFVQIDGETGLEILSKNPRVLFYEKEIDEELGGIADNDIVYITVRDVRYRAKKIMSDGFNFLNIELKNA